MRRIAFKGLEQRADWQRSIGQDPTLTGKGIRKDWVGFNEDIGLPIHPYTNLPAPLTFYQVMMGEYKGKRTITNKINKVGITDLFIRINLRRAVVGDCQGYQILYGSSKEKMANENLQRTADIIRNSKLLNPLLAGEPTANEIHLSNGAEFIALPRKVSSFRSWPRVKSIFLDEAAHYELIEDREFFAAALSRLTNTDGYLDIVSTPHGQRGYFYRLFTDAVAGKNGFKWWIVTEADGLKAGLLRPEILDEAKKSMSPELYQQEYGNSFIPGIGTMAIESDLTKSMESDYESE